MYDSSFEHHIYSHRNQEGVLVHVKIVVDATNYIPHYFVMDRTAGAFIPYPGNIPTDVTDIARAFINGLSQMQSAGSYNTWKDSRRDS